jgi:hypothetical protein
VGSLAGSGTEGIMTREEQRVFLEATADLFRCPNTGRIIEGEKHDDKVVCGCGKQNPKTPYREGISGVVHHVKRYLVTVTVDEYLDEEEKRRNSK